MLSLEGVSTFHNDHRVGHELPTDGAGHQFLHAIVFPDILLEGGWPLSSLFLLFIKLLADDHAGQYSSDNSDSPYQQFFDERT